MFTVSDSAARPLALVLSPILLAQGRAMKRRMPLIPEAAGPRSGSAGSGAGQPLSLLIFGESTAAGVGVDSNEEGMAARSPGAWPRANARMGESSDRGPA